MEHFECLYKNKRMSSFSTHILTIQSDVASVAGVFGMRFSRNLLRRTERHDVFGMKH